MPNYVQAIRESVLAAHPEATIFGRGRNWIRHRIADAPDGRQRFVLDAAIGSYHYLDTDVWQEIDTDWIASAEATWDWEMAKSHWRALVKNGGWIGLTRHGVDFGLKLFGWCYLNSATKEHDSVRQASYGIPTISGDTLTWANIFNNVDLSLLVGADTLNLRSDIPQAVRANLPIPPYPLSDTWFVLVWQVEWANVPRIARVDTETWWKRQDQALEPSRGLFLADLAGKVQNRIDMGIAVAGDSVIEMKQRFINEDGNYYLLHGAPAIGLQGLPVGDLRLVLRIDLGYFPVEEA
jgi:hypothetical protein